MGPLHDQVALITGTSAPRGIGRAIALRDAGTPEGVAYLSGPGSRHVTGINLPVTGGVPAGI